MSMLRISATNVTKSLPGRREPILHPLSFTTEASQNVGLIGPNGAGKTTLLRLLAGTITPTSGSLAVTGTTTAFLEMGVGFHDDLNLIDNIKVLAALLNQPHTLRQLLPEILAFAELTAVADQPFRRLSHGQKDRVAMATVLHVNTDILILDEALAVGDEYFFLRCLNRLQRLHRQGTTLIISSHNLWLIEQLCPRTIWLEAGQIRAQGPTHTIISEYRAATAARLTSSVP